MDDFNLAEEIKKKFLEEVLAIEKELKDKPQASRKQRIETLITKIYNEVNKKESLK